MENIWRGPAQKQAATLSAQGFNEGKGKPFSQEDIRFTAKGKTIFATVMAWPTNGSVLITSLQADSSYYPGKINSVQLVATGQELKFERNAEGLRVYFPDAAPCSFLCKSVKNCLIWLLLAVQLVVIKVKLQAYFYLFLGFKPIFSHFISLILRWYNNYNKLEC